MSMSRVKDDPGWCEWTLIDAEFNAYDTSCRNPWYLEAGTPEDNKMIYCPACGRKIKVVKENKVELKMSDGKMIWYHR